MKTTNEFKSKETNNLKAIIKEKTGFQFTGNSMMIQAFTRSSYAAEHGICSNEMFELIGDQVLNYTTVKLISERFGAFNAEMNYRFRINEKQLTELKNSLISNENLSKIIDKWNVMDYLVVSKSDMMNQVDQQTKVKADLFEAILGFIAIKSNWDSQVLETAVKKMLKIDKVLDEYQNQLIQPVSFTIDNAVNTLKEFAEHQKCTMPEYTFASEKELGYDEDNNPIWSCTCSTVDEKTGYTKVVFSSSKNNAKKAAAYLVLCDMFELQNEYGVNHIGGVWCFKDNKLYLYSEKYI